MKVLFAGPSLYSVDPDLSGLESRGPAAHGDITRAVLDGATAIGLVDGNFEAVAAVWHKEIGFALKSGVTMLGSSSMGALRAAECAPLGMIPVGVIANAYASGELDDDAAVALTHAPAECAYLPLTEPLVDVKPTLARLLALGLIAEDEHADLWHEAVAIHFKQRTVETMFADRRIRDAYQQHRVNQKADDAVQLIAELRALATGGTTATAMTGNSLFERAILPELRTGRAA